MRNRHSHNVTVEVNGKIENTFSYSTHTNAIEAMLSYVENRPVVMKTSHQWGTRKQEYTWENAPLNLTIKFYITDSYVNRNYEGRDLMDSIFDTRPDTSPIDFDGNVIPFRPR